MKNTSELRALLDGAEAEDLATLAPREAYRSRAAGVLDRILASGDVTVEEVAASLLVSVVTIEAYREGRLPIPLDRQLLLAAYVIERTPNYGRLGHALRSQVRAAIAYALRSTQTHDGRPPSTGWSS